MNKILSISIAIIVLIIAVEGGYYWGINRGFKNTPASLVPAKNENNNPTIIFNNQDSADLQTTLSAITLLFKPQVIDHLKGIPTTALWGSTWSIAIGGKLSSLSDKEISLELTSGQGVKSWTLPPLIHYLMYNETTQQSTPISKETIQLGDTIGFSVNFDTQTGEAEEGWINKNVK